MGGGDVYMKQAEDGSSRVFRWLWCSWLLSHISLHFHPLQDAGKINVSRSIDIVLLLDNRIIIVEFPGFSFLFFSFLSNYLFSSWIEKLFCVISNISAECELIKSNLMQIVLVHSQLHCIKFKVST